MLSAAATASALSLLGSALPAAAAGTTWYVDGQNGSAAADCGQSAGTGACRTIGAALDKAGDGDTVSIADGTYTEAITVADAITLHGTSRDGVVLNSSGNNGGPTVDIDADVTISGMTISSGEPSATSGPNANVIVAPDRTVTLSQVDVTTPTDPAQKYATGVIAGSGSTLTLDHTAVSGFSDYGAWAGYDPGVDIQPGPATVLATDSSLSDNAGGLLLLAGKATLTGGSVSGNSRVGLMGNSSDVTFDVTGTSITSNGSTEAESLVLGGVVLQQGGTFTGTDVTLSDNFYGLAAWGGSITLTGSTVTGNGGTSQDGRPIGAGVLGRPGFDQNDETIPLTVTIDGSEISGNSYGLQVAENSAGTAATHVQVSDTTIADNSAAGIWAVFDTPDVDTTVQVTGSTITGNGPDNLTGVHLGAAGGLAITGPVDATVTDTDISRNTLGIAAALGAHVTVTGGTVSGNAVFGLGAGSLSADPDNVPGTTLSITGTSITENGLQTATPFAYPAGLLVGDATVTGSGLDILGNGLGAVVSGGSLSLADSAVSGNVAADNGSGKPTGAGILTGATQGQAASVTLERTEVSGNQADGLWLIPGTVVQVDASTIAGNLGAGVTGTIPDESEPGQTPAARLLLTGSTVAGNAGGALEFAAGLQVTSGGSILQAPDGISACAGDVATLVDGGNNLASDDSCDLDADTSTVGDPLLGALDSNGGPTQTMLPAPASPAVNAIAAGATVGQGDQAVPLCADGVVDQRGTTRPQGSACDIGAVERTSGLITVTASDAALYHGDPPPQVTPSYAGFTGDDSVDDLDTLPTCGFDQAAGTTSCSGADDDFYQFTYVPGTLTILDPPSVTTSRLPGGQVGEDYAARLAATDGATPYHWSITGGQFPDGLTLHEDGHITGKPTAGGPFQFTVTVSDANSVTAHRQLTITVDAPACTTRPFPDVRVDDPNCPAIAWAADRGISTGYPDGDFHAERTVTRQTMAAFLYRMTHDGDSAPDCQHAPFDDVPVDNPFCGAITWLADHQVATGYGDGDFHPVQAVTNQTMAAMLYRLDHDGSTAPDCQQPPFPDVDVHNPFCGAIAWISGVGIATGDSGGFGPADVVTRGSMASTLYYDDQYRARVTA